MSSERIPYNILVKESNFTDAPHKTKFSSYSCNMYVSVNKWECFPTDDQIKFIRYDEYEKQQKEINRLKKENELLMKCAEFYGDENNWENLSVINDQDFLAEKTLKQIKEMRGE